MHERGVANDVGDRGRGVAWGKNHPHFRGAKIEAVTICKHVVPIVAATDLEIGDVIDVRPDRLNCEGLFANACWHAKALAQVGDGRKVVSMRVGVEHPFRDQSALPDMGGNLVGWLGRKAA